MRAVGAAAQALTVGAHLTALGAVAHDRTGAKVHDLLPPVGAAPPLRSATGPPPPDGRTGACTG